MRFIVFAVAALFASSVFAQDVPANRMPDKSKTPGHAPRPDTRFSPSCG